MVIKRLNKSPTVFRASAQLPNHADYNELHSDKHQVVTSIQSDDSSACTRLEVSDASNFTHKVKIGSVAPLDVKAANNNGDKSFLASGSNNTSPQPPPSKTYSKIDTRSVAPGQCPNKTHGNGEVWFNGSLANQSPTPKSPSCIMSGNKIMDR